jgi:hypothetical protein
MVVLQAVADQRAVAVAAQELQVAMDQLVGVVLVAVAAQVLPIQYQVVPLHMRVVVVERESVPLGQAE